MNTPTHFPGQRFTVASTSGSPAAGRRVIVDGYPETDGRIRVRVTSRPLPDGSWGTEVLTSELK